MFRHALMFFGAVVLTLAAETTTAQIKGCPAGTAIQGIDFTTRKLVCVPVGVGALKVIDSANQEVGLLLDSGTLIRLLDNEWIVINFSRNGFFDTVFTVYFETVDCTGQMYFPDFFGPTLPRPVITVLRGSFATLYYPAPGTFVERTIRSFGNFGATGISECVLVSEFKASVGLPQTSTISAFTPPFRVEQ
jgi:hypothetical protein